MEIWKDVIGFEDFYQISDYGRIKCKEQIIEYSDGHKEVKRAKILHGTIRHGYHHVDIKQNGERYFLAVHRLVAEVFIPNPDNKPHVNHIDGDRLNNIPSNLEWVTPSENQIHAVDTGLKRTRKVAQYDFNGNLIKIHKNINQAAKAMGDTGGSTNIRKVVNGKRLSAYGYKWVLLDEGATTISKESTLKRVEAEGSRMTDDIV
jgi:hypothetical protein